MTPRQGPRKGVRAGRGTLGEQTGGSAPTDRAGVGRGLSPGAIRPQCVLRPRSRRGQPGELLHARSTWHSVSRSRHDMGAERDVWGRGRLLRAAIAIADQWGGSRHVPYCDVTSDHLAARLGRGASQGAGAGGTGVACGQGATDGGHSGRPDAYHDSDWGRAASGGGVVTTVTPKSK